MRHSAPTRRCDCALLILWLNCGVLEYVYCPSPGVQYPDGGMGFVFWEWVGGYLAVYEIKSYVEAQFVPPVVPF